MLTLGLFKKSRHSIAQCVLVALQPDGTVAVADSKDTQKAPHTYTRQEWEAFVTGVKEGEFDYPNIAKELVGNGS